MKNFKTWFFLVTSLLIAWALHDDPRFFPMFFKYANVFSAGMFLQQLINHDA